MTDTVRPATIEDVRDAVADAARDDVRLMVQGGGSKRDIGAPTPPARLLDMRGLSGVIDYDPAELVLTVGAGTPLATVAALVAQAGQMLAFDPFDHGPLLGRAAGEATIGGVVAAGVAGSRRLSRGGARDHLLGFKAVSGRGEIFVGGAKVVKNVTGYDLPKLMAGSWGQLTALAELTLKVLPRPRETATLVLHGLDTARAVTAMACAMGSPAEVAAAAHRPAESEDGACTAFRLQGFGPSVAARAAMLAALLSSFGATLVVPHGDAAAYWEDLRTLAPLDGTAPLWRIVLPPSAAPTLITALERHDPQWLLDWAGGLIWLAIEAQADIVRAAAEGAGGHAMLVRAPPALRATVPAFHPPAAGVAALEARVRRAFDPRGIFETGRF